MNWSRVTQFSIAVDRIFSIKRSQSLVLFRVELSCRMSQQLGQIKSIAVLRKKLNLTAAISSEKPQFGH
jgi:hypothetical protein